MIQWMEKLLEWQQHDGLVLPQCQNTQNPNKPKGKFINAQALMEWKNKE